MGQFAPFIGFILLLVISTVFSKKAEQARRRSQEGNQGTQQRAPHREHPHRPSGVEQGPSMADLDATNFDASDYEDLGFEDVDLITEDGSTRFTDDLAAEMLENNHHLAKQLSTLERWNRRS